MKKLLFILLAFALSGVKADQRPNIILIYTDDHGWPDLGAAGVYQDLKTPHLDALAADGIRCTDGYSTAPQCVPSRAGLLVGKSQNRFGVEANKEPLDGFHAEQTIAERLQEAGYVTGQIGKWHLGPVAQITNHGFEHVFAKNSNRPGWANFDLSGKSVQGGPEQSGLYHLDACSKAARTFIVRHREKPFFLYLAYRAPHVPLDAPKKYLSRFPGKMPERRRQALAMISAMDDGVGLIRKTLKSHQIAKRTLIFFIADNGAPLKIHKLDAPGGGPGWDGSLNKPMNGEKGMLTEGGIRVPFLVAYPGNLPAGLVHRQPVSTLDVAATAAALAKLPDAKGLDGLNLIPRFRTDTKPSARPLYWRWTSQAAVREGRWKLLRGGSREYLFDLHADPGETKNLLGQHPERATELRKKLATWAATLKPAGLKEGKMGDTWNRYFDFYLDGKPAPPLPNPKQRLGAREEKAKPIHGWLPRGCKLELTDKHLSVQPLDGARRGFLAKAGIKQPGPLTVEVNLRTQNDGAAGVSWREQGQRDFVAEQQVRTKVAKSDEWQKVRIEVPSTKEIIHLRLLLPKGPQDIRSIDLINKEGNSVQTWSFQPSDSSNLKR